MFETNKTFNVEKNVFSIFSAMLINYDFKSILIHILSLNVVLDLFINLSSSEY